MKGNVNPAVAAVVIIVVVAVVAFFGWRAIAHPHEMVTEPQDMKKMMGGKANMAPPPNAIHSGGIGR